MSEEQKTGQRNNENRFEIVSFSRSDLLEHFTESDLNRISDEELKSMADRAADEYYGQFWGDLLHEVSLALKSEDDHE